MKTIFLAVFLLGGLVLAQRLPDAWALYDDGEFLKASQLARQIETSPAQALAARALYEYAMQLPESKREPLMVQCEKFARTALELDETNADGYFELGASAGQFALLRGTVWAFLNGIPQQIRGYFEKAIVLNPRHTFAMIALARWHAEVVAGGGAFLYGASPAEALKLPNRPVQLEPKNINIRVNFAETLMVLGIANKAAAIAQLEVAVTLTPRDYLERQALVSAKKALAEMKQ